ncbi:putative disease resistance RPP13-like protein 1 [Humulus lupulus]|uniref:putative disease resistance RPP13-like protein 1 n=1 Tax=Humulus lupulus TaxID=3486 RepID=UPI002B4035C2|nr:putative disease resistance RPP13-like protein 1 [Humulus lupulus]
MAVELVVGPIVSASVEFLLKKIVSSNVASFLRGKKDSGFDMLLDKLETTLLSLAEVLGDAELKQFTNPRVEKWLDKLQDAVDDAEDLFEEIEYDALKLEVEAESEPDKSKVSKFISSFNSADQDRKADMEKLLERLDTFEKKRYILDLQKGVEKIQSQRPPSISSIDDSEFFGRDDEKKILKGMLLSDDVGGEKICVIPIVGMGGIGKTTLAQALYNDDEVSIHFEFKAWVCVSDEFDVRKVTKNVLEAVIEDACAVENLNVLQGKIQEKLKGKKFLIVLDDVWNEEYSFWDTMRMLFKVGAQGSKIIVTTRSEIVASIMGTTASRHLEELKEEACFKLFVKIVSGNKAFTVESDLGRMGKDIVKKCKGLPLAVKALASLLRLTDVKEWKRIANSDVLDLPIGGKNILPALRLSYHYLPSHLKRCFVYCSLFPKDYEFSKEQLVSLWMVDNLLEHSSGNRTLKEVGFEYFDDLVSRSFFQLLSKRYSYSKDCFVMHDLMVDLAIFVSRKKFVYIEQDKPYEIGLMKQTRHIAFDRNKCHNFHEMISEATCLRTFLPVVKYLFPSEIGLQDVLKDFMKLRRLRFLFFGGYENVNELPKSIGQLRHLRYLNLSYTSIKEFPKSFCMLYNLQTLVLTSCEHLTKFPKNLHHLVNLTYLEMSHCKFCTMPPLGQLPALKTLSIEGCDAIELVGLDFYGTSSSKSFPSLESLTFQEMSNWKEWSFPKAHVEVFPKLTSLTISVCEKLSGDLPCILPSLTELYIFQCPELASSLPVMPSVTAVGVDQCEKIGGFKSCKSLQDFPVNLEDLHLRYCDNLDFVPPSDYKSLQKLSIDDISSSFKVLSLDSFPNVRTVEVCHCELESLLASNTHEILSTLSIEECPKFTLLIDSNLHCPILTQLHFISCDALKFLPEPLPILLPSLQELYISGCPELESLPTSGLPFSLRKLTFENCHKLKLLPDQQHNILPSLQELFIYGCPELESLPRSWLPFSLSKLYIRNCTKVIACRQNWNLQDLPILTSFDIGKYNGEDMESFLEQGSLPTSLTSLRIENVACLKYLDDKGFQELTSLKELIIYNCPNLQTLPVKGLPPSFEGLLPPSFESFLMIGCPLLEAKYEWEKEYRNSWSKISCIPQPQVTISRQPQVPISRRGLLIKPSFSCYE